ncbi:glycosyltransferase family 2 protein [Tabrizicola sp. WMC-M-20]|nr:glycosyltransferase family 2 protein [Tabrizicola sp. WMC-M-20]
MRHANLCRTTTQILNFKRNMRRNMTISTVYQPAEHPPAQSGTDPPKVSVIIVNWNTRDILRDCLASVRAQTRARHEVIVIDNASRDGSAEMVATEFPDVRLVANTDNRGFAGANNQGLAIAHGANLLLLNPDTLIIDSAIDRMLDWLAAHPDVGCVGCQVLEGPGVIQQTCFADPTPLRLMVVELGLHRLGTPALARPFYRDWDRTTEREVDVVSGMFMLLPRAVFTAVGPLDPAFFVYAEEADWCRRIRAAGWRCVFAPVAQIIHLDGGSKSTAQIKPRMHVQMQKSHLIYARKHHGPGGYALVKGLFVGSALTRWAMFGLLARLRCDETSEARVRLSRAALCWHLAGREPQS